MLKIILSILALIYTLVPYDFIPDILPLWGWIDDIFVLYLLWRTFYRARRTVSGQSHTDRVGADHREKTQQAHHGDAGNVHQDPKKDPYSVLGVPREATQDEIKTAYRRLSNQYHPDKVHHLGEEFQKLAEQRFKEIQEAYQALKRGR